jgi:aminomethyltransferase
MNAPMNTATSLQKTPLHAAHTALNARMVNFSGWEMPLHYGSQIEEHHWVRKDAGMFDVSHMCIVEVTSLDRTAGAFDSARAFLRYAAANNVDKLTTPGKALYSCLLNTEGGVVDDVIIYFYGEHHFRLVVNAATAEKDCLWLEKLRQEGDFAVDIQVHRELSIIAVQGPQARARVWAAFPEIEALTASLKPFHCGVVPRVKGTLSSEVSVARTGYTGEDGFELMLPAEFAPDIWNTLHKAGVHPCGLAARDTLRLEAGLNLYGQDMTETVSPLDAGLAWTVDLNSPRDFVGKTALVRDGARTVFLGLLLRLEHGRASGVLRAHQSVRTEHGEGELTSGAFSPTLQRSIGFARMPLRVQVGDVVYVRIRDKELPADVVHPVFVKKGQVQVHETLLALP